MSIAKNVHCFTSLNPFTIRSMGEKEMEQKKSANFGKASGRTDGKEGFSLDTG